MKQHLYDIYGFMLSVDDSANKWFEKEYWRFKIKKARKDKVNLFVNEMPSEKKFSTEEIKEGMLLPFGKDKVLLFNPKVFPPSSIQMNAEFFLRWRDKCFLHAGAVSKDKTLIFPAGPNVGKTSIVSQFLQRGFDYLSDDWLIIGGGKAYPFPKTIHIFDYNMIADKKIARKILGNKYIFYNFYVSYFKLKNFLIDRLPPGLIRWWVEQVLTLKYYVDVQDLYPDIKVGKISKISHVFFLERTDDKKKIQISEIDPVKLAIKMAFINQYERNDLFKKYCRYVFEKNFRNKEVEKAFEHDKQVILDTFRRAKKVYRVLIPRKTKPSEIFNSIWASL